jgi:hypothetical protein
MSTKNKQRKPRTICTVQARKEANKMSREKETMFKQQDKTDRRSTQTK